MVLSYTIGKVIGFVLGGAVFISVFLYLRRLMPSRIRATILMSILCSAFVVGLLSLFFYSVYIVDQDLKVKRFLVCGSPECEAGDGSMVKVSRQAQTMIVNQSEIPLFVEEVLYSAYPTHQETSRGTLIPKHSVGAAVQIDFLIEERPPLQLQLKSADEYRYWLRPATEEEISR